MSIAPTFHKMEVWLWLQGISAGQKPLPCMCLHKSDKFPILSGSSGRPAVCGERQTNIQCIRLSLVGVWV